jgi:hypothetical protein
MIQANELLKRPVQMIGNVGYLLVEAIEGIA